MRQARLLGYRDPTMSTRMSQPHKRPQAKLPPRLGAVVENLRGSLWLIPTVSVLAAIGVGAWLSSFDVPEQSPIRHVVFPGGPEGARGVLQAVATSVITVTSLVFSLTVVALQLASTQFSPRLLRTFLRRPSNQIVLSIFIATFVYSLVVLRSIRSTDAVFVPDLAVTVGFGLALMSVGALVFFINHITTEIRVDTLMWRVEQDTVTAIDTMHPDAYDADRSPPLLPQRPSDAVPVPSTRSGIIQAVAEDALRGAQTDHDVTILLARHVGDHVVEDGTLAWLWVPDGTPPPHLPSAAQAINRAVTIGHERTMQQDISYGIRQLVDIAVKAMSPGINDPTTAGDAVGHLASILTVLARRSLDPLVLSDPSGRVCVFVQQPSFPDYLESAVSQIRRYGAADPEVLLALLDLCREVAHAVVRPQDAAAVREHVQLLTGCAERSLDEPRDVRDIEDAAAAVTAVLDGARPRAIVGVRRDS